MTTISHTPNLIGQGVESLASSKTDSQEKVEQLAQEFEGVFLSLLTKELRSTVGEGGLFGSETSDSYGSLFDQFLGEHLATAQPLGIASLFVDNYQQNSNAQTTQPTLSQKA